MLEADINLCSIVFLTSFRFKHQSDKNSAFLFSDWALNGCGQIIGLVSLHVSKWHLQFWVSTQKQTKKNGQSNFNEIIYEPQISRHNINVSALEAFERLNHFEMSFQTFQMQQVLAVVLTEPSSFLVMFSDFKSQKC